MKKITKVVLSLAIVVAVISSFSVSAFAAFKDETTVQPLTTYITTFFSSFSTSGLSCDMKGEIKGNSSVTKVKIKLELQKQKGGVYTTVDSWEKTFNSRTGSLSESDIINPLSTYRLKTTFTAYSGTKSESKVVYRYE